MNKELEKIIMSNRKYYFVSPHFDDVVYSAGGLLSSLQSDKTAVINVFTKASPPPYTFTAKKYLKSCGFKDARRLFDIRKREDEQVLNSLGVRVINLGYLDALFRKSWNGANYFKFFPEIYHTHPVTVFKNRFYLRNEKKLIKEIYINLAEVIESKSYVFCPAAIGSHVDHEIVREACERLDDVEVVFWEDYPYNARNGNAGNDQHSITKLTFNQNQKLRKKLIKKYASQYEAVFPNGLELENEGYYIN